MTNETPLRRRVFASMMVSLDGFIEGPNRSLDWHVAGKEFERYCDDMLDAIDLVLLGRVSYEMMIGYWPAAERGAASSTERAFARKMNELPKIVLSRTLASATWNTRIVKDHVVEEIEALKGRPGKDIAVFGGAGIIATLREHRLIDEYRLIVNPVVLGSGTPLFHGVAERMKMQLTRSTTLRTGVVILTYEPA